MFYVKEGGAVLDFSKFARGYKTQCKKSTTQRVELKRSLIIDIRLKLLDAKNENCPLTFAKVTRDSLMRTFFGTLYINAFAVSVAPGSKLLVIQADNGDQHKK